MPIRTVAQVGFAGDFADVVMRSFELFMRTPFSLSLL